MADAPLDAVVIGGGPAGLATSYELGRRRLRHVVLATFLFVWSRCLLR